LSRTETEEFEAVQEGIMKLSLLGTAGYLDRAAGGPCPPVGTALFQPIAFVQRFMNKKSYGPVIAVGSVISLFLIADPAAADSYKWCAAYRNGGTNCGFTTIEQCRATVSGVGGFCEPNHSYTAPDKTSAQRSQKQAQRKPPAEHRAQERRSQERRATETPAPERRVPEDRFQ
jgi:Protein of unknown function (DUF3551)